MTTIEPPEKHRLAGASLDAPSKSDAAEAASAHSRINIPLNLANWKDLPEDVGESLLWFHQYALDTGMSLAECAQALNYDNSTVFRVLKGTYEGSWKNVRAAVESYKKIVIARAGIQKTEFAENGMTRLIFDALNYALANNSITLITGESRMGKTTAARQWKEQNNHGRSVLVIAPAYGGTKALLRDLCSSCGQGVNKNASDAHASVLRAFNKNRILIVDEAHRLLPGDRRTNPVNLELLRDIHDRTGCALALLATARFAETLKASTYMFEQLLGRIGLPVRLPRDVKPADIEPIVRQYIKRPTAKLMECAETMANDTGRLGLLVETLKVASRIASKAGEPLAEQHVFKALALRKQMMGELQFAAK